MARPLRIEFPGAVYHVTSRGDRREPIFEDDGDRAMLLNVVARMLDRFDALALAYCLMGNHYHFVLGTRRANLSMLMRQINGVYTQAYNRRHGLVGHLFQGRFKAILVDREGYLLEVCRYVDLNPVRAGMVDRPGDWPWSSYRAHCGLAEPLPWLDTPGLHGFLLGQEAQTREQKRKAALMYAQLVLDGPGVHLWEESLRQQIYLGDDEFVQRQQDEADRRNLASREVPKAQRMHQASLAQWLSRSTDRAEALWHAHKDSGMTMTALAEELGVSVARVSQLIRRHEDFRFKT
ncbi:REP-associated tyrosine transposase [Paucibacter sp. XJ19-41]|uniref:REP-associated tyrosine transposase n=1 Tax=Paucibacter sp. XJ19-41 TaxID=2927824 RepID=UPI002349AE7E|nr:transposase [Paucibacter sp. XJ19-41]MDC6170468.1 transposase [Paucibacter sp. XJ19-41]